ncbi:RuBisCO accumulation factor 1 [Okeania sp.]|uniref:RuBisCO accumulation factor 1 n=1 Tax=Okeania sp. TaxID=3100323 RepID=UPI002B4B33C5|nr:RuBisCO accumulation factor 1 [Okeania sp.]MEB3340066.1 RuBisCO accumulation factor 1 [Okeania sp.]
MTETPQKSSNSQQKSTNSVDAENLIVLLRRKEGNWVEWGNACATLQKAGYTSQQIFEETGFEPIHQNQVIVGSQVYTSIVNAKTEGNSLPSSQQKIISRFEKSGSDILYELRILTQEQRIIATEFLVTHNLDADDAKDVAKAMKDFARMKVIPEGFSDSPGDIVAYQCWKQARQQNDLQHRSRLIAKGLKLADSQTARKQLEKLLTDFTVVSQRPAPRLPVYRLEQEEELPRILPVIGKLPLNTEDFKAVPLVEEVEPFNIVKFSGGAGAWVGIPGWRVVMQAEAPVVIIENSDRLPTPIPGTNEEVLLIIDRSQRQWHEDGYFIIDQEGKIVMQWFDEEPNVPLLGRILLALRPKKIFDREVIKDLWQIEE